MAVVLIGCSIHASKDERGKDKDVDIRTPFGSLSVHKGSGDAKDTGLPLYPGARLKSGSDHDDNANVNISSSMFGLKVVAQKFESDDSADKILNFSIRETNLSRLRGSFGIRHFVNAFDGIGIR